MKEMVEKLDKKNGKVFWFVLGIVIPFLLNVLSILGFFKWDCGDEICISLFVITPSVFVIV